MAYTVNKFDGTLIATVEDGTIDNTTNLRFIGKNYAGYGEIQNENFLHMLENFAGGTAPSRPIAGQMWYDSATAKLKFYDGSKFRTTGGAEISATAPTGLTTGDFWWDTANSQLYAWDGSSFILVGPQGVGSTVTQFTSRQIQDTLGAQQLIIEGKVNNITVVTFSSTEFTIDSTQSSNTITGFDVIKKGITLNTDISDVKFQGTATDSDKLGGVTAANYLRSNANDTTSGVITVANDGGVVVGADSDLALTVDSTGAIISNVTSDTDITFKVNDGGVTTTVMTIDGSSSRVGIGTLTPTTKLDVSGTINATAFTGPITGDVIGDVTGDVTGDLTGNITSSGTSTMGATTFSGTITSQSIQGDTGSTYNLGASGTTYAGAFIDTATLTTMLTTGIQISANNISGRRSNDDINITPSGTGAVVAGAIRLSGSSISSDDSTGVTISDELRVTNIASPDSAQVTVNDGLTINGAVVMMSSLPTSDPSNAGQLYNDSGTLKISAG